jgi:hypothetical protein
MTLTAKETAARLDQNEYRKEGSRELWAEMKASGLVAVFGASDDLMEFRGAIDEELDAYDGTTAYVTAAGMLKSECECDCPYFKRIQEKAASIEAIWCGTDDGLEFSWTYKTTIPHAKFTIIESCDDDTDLYCRGIVFALADVPA